jgi:hypothetical protein
LTLLTATLDVRRFQVTERFPFFSFSFFLVLFNFLFIFFFFPIPFSSRPLTQLAFSEDDAEEMRIRTKLVDSLKTALRTQPHSFVQRFIELDGLPSLLGALGSMDELTAHCGLHNAYIGCVKALMNNSVRPAL